MNVPEPYVYDRVAVTKIIDGDTLHADFDLGFGITFREQIIRLARINAPELATPQGPPARDALSSMILGATVTMKTIKDRKEKFGRYLGEIWLNGVNVNDQMVSQGFAVPYLV